ncbi:MAG: Clp protease N-terminal domain-containing protein, partial [Cyanobacteria bacterium J06627_8]
PRFTVVFECDRKSLKPMAPPLIKMSFATAENLIRDWLANHTVPPADIPTEIPFTSRTCRILELAAKQVQRQREGHITPQHLLLGNLQEGETGGGLAMHVLQTCNVDCDRLKQQLSNPC